IEHLPDALVDRAARYAGALVASAERSRA
ncbi:MAG: hypothetical protein QOE87_3704, partial [Gaiellales bacterium]|nr:hypothetical protein [Gaiellales bacterium]